MSCLHSTLQSQRMVDRAKSNAVVQMMHKGWLLERSTWEDKCRAARSVYGIADAMVHLEDWINLDYPENSEVTKTELRAPLS